MSISQLVLYQYYSLYEKKKYKAKACSCRNTNMKNIAINQ